ncbi:thiamine phosphate synthase [Buchnera aphidicola (Mindarus keteleerifoliae)]|uniref:thiamine phosphate synthase n=1 Tax=Buchnera aphidicola TaxID=9 RepID=UPI0031B6E1C7
MKNFPKIKKKIGLYPIVDSIDWIKKLSKFNIRNIQLRIKKKLDIYVEKDIKKAIKISKLNNFNLYINDHWELAIKYKSYGVHLGQEDLKKADLKLILDSGIKLGISTKNQFEFNQAKLLQPSYIAIGHIFPTFSKRMKDMPQGLKKVEKYIQEKDNFPIVAIGGITLRRLPLILNFDIDGISLISAITKSKNWKISVLKFLKMIKKHWK